MTAPALQQALRQAPQPALILEPLDMFARRIGPRGRQPMAFGRLGVRVVAVKTDDGERPLEREVALDLVANPSGHLISFNQVTGADGVVRRPYFKAGRYDLRVESEFYRPLRLSGVAFGAATGAFTLPLEPGWRYPFPTAPIINGDIAVTVLKGMVVDGKGRGVIGAVIACADAPPDYETDATGQFALTFPTNWSGTAATLTITAAGAAPLEVQVPVERGRINGAARPLTIQTIPPTGTGTAATVSGSAAPQATPTE